MTATLLPPRLCPKCRRVVRGLKKQFYDYPAGEGSYYHLRCWMGRRIEEVKND